MTSWVIYRRLDHSCGDRCSPIAAARAHGWRHRSGPITDIADQPEAVLKAYVGDNPLGRLDLNLAPPLRFWVSTFAQTRPRSEPYF